MEKKEKEDLMKYHKVDLVNEIVLIKKCCHTCLFMMPDTVNGIMVCGGNNEGVKPYGYGDHILNEELVCDNYKLSFHEFQNMPPKQFDDPEKYLYY